MKAAQIEFGVQWIDRNAHRDGGGGLMAPAEFRVGQAVRILDGPFTNFVGIVRAVATTPEGLITVGVGLQGREVPVEIDRYRLEQIR